jgi:2-iminobutanoate/2-iminopropanoate deaminase
MMTYHKSLAAKLGKTLPTAALALVLAFSAQAATTTNPTLTQSKPIFLGGGGEYPFSSAVRVGNTLYMSGQIGFKDGKLVEGGVKAEAKQALDNINGTLLQYGYQKSDLVKCMVMLTDMDDFNDFNDVYKTELAKPYPVRSAFGVADLAAGASVEIECMAAK